MINNTLTYISLFSSAGVGCFGFKQAGFECIATNEILPRRLQVQRHNQKCKYDSGYISGDIQNNETKQAIYQEIEKWQKLGNDKVDVVIATPPCQGMSVANHKKNDKDLDRNSLIVQSVETIKKINPRFFIFENVSAFWKTGCVNSNNGIIAIGDMILSELGGQYSIFYKIINFKNYGSFSSRTRTIVIGVERKLSQYISPLELFPDYQDEVLLKDVIGDMKPLGWGEYDSSDFFHSFRIYPEHMRAWIKGIKQGQSAFEQTDPLKIPHQIKDGKIVINASKNGDKYTRQKYDSVAPCIHTRNDQLASQNTVHPIDDRVFSIRELMKMMSIPNEFKWLDKELTELNALSFEHKRKLSKKEEMNIRQSIGEAVPTIIFRQIAEKIKLFMQKQKLSEKQIYQIIDEYQLQDTDNLINYIKKNRDNIDLSSLSSVIELANAKRQNNSAFFTNKFIINEIIKELPKFKKDEITILEPSVGSGNFLPLLFKLYDDIRKVNLIVVDIDKEMIKVLKVLYDKEYIPNNFNIEFICQNFMEFKINQPIDLIVGNPPFTKLTGIEINQYLPNNFNKNATNLAEFFLEKALSTADYVSFVMPKNLLNTPEYDLTRKLLSSYAIKNILDIGEKGFKGVLVETINILIAKNEKIGNVKIHSLTENIKNTKPQHYIFDSSLPYWVIYRDDFFDRVAKKLNFDVFNVFRDRQITNSNSSLKKKSNDDIRVIKSRNINDTGTQLLDIEDYDTFLSSENLEIMAVSKFLQRDDVYMTPNMTYKPRLMKKSKGYIVNGSVALLIPKSDFALTDEQMLYISSDEFREFYKIARNYQTRSLNIDTTSVYWFGIYQG
ncbi:DNA methyltransferase [Moraxella bovoculi]|uniref:DNA (cytosine-5-)-methyltransferase n=1 Tax=Moraxella bovoculi TaxID=386891 RepID=A0AAC8PWJ3_9GAMM|nr:DNA cytosine methyltransferase [Moraxella bovoculi]AKG08179.1 DNA methyltransferase [Moraxella bovoculi]AKG09265.1 DNA methyltransferase [Moraxella bovoculi]AKG11099.1 DNA methyltransferase [Moraxella bovoculi]AKG13091.1 DNA methyltransferase [Moraxella bovoculi]